MELLHDGSEELGRGAGAGAVACDEADLLSWMDDVLEASCADRGGKGVSHKLFAGLFCLDRIGMHHLDELCIIYLYGLAARADSELCPHASSLLSCFDQHTGRS